MKENEGINIMSNGEKSCISIDVFTCHAWFGLGFANVVPGVQLRPACSAAVSLGCHRSWQRLGTCALYIAASLIQRIPESG